MIFNREDLLEKVGGMDELIKELVKIFLEDAPIGYENIKKAILEKNFEKIYEYAHGIKGSAMSLNIEDYEQITSKLEISGLEKIDNLDELEKELDESYKNVIKVLKEELE